MVVNIVELPALRASEVVAVTLERAQLSGSATWVVSLRRYLGQPACRRWYATEAEALAFAAEQAERYGLLLIDLREPVDA